MMYYTGEGVAKDPVQAFEWFRKAAEQGNSYGQDHLGMMYERGDAATKDPVQAASWYRKAAEQGNEDARGAMERLANKNN